MPNSTNPFARGFQNFRIQRTLCIGQEDDCPPIWRSLHASQAHLSDEQIALFPCIFNKDFALITEGQAVPDELDTKCPSDGVVRLVAYGVIADDLDGNAVHVGDVYTEAAARELVQRLQFQTGVYSRCWEISTGHLTTGARRDLLALAEIAPPSRALFTAFRIPGGATVGIKLSATPWTDANLQRTVGCTADALRNAHRDNGVPESLVDVLHLAGQADVRMLVFDADAPVLDGLKHYRE
ncbi:ABC transporter substrate-binding protein [Ralstonia solanacearum]|nr:ABC transporter substrate-binding protein [Ralstonia solanacearum]NKG09664.1 ABC transporter substrate-binding protein [Ralstonia solanacearum]